jgi:glutaredoxin
MLMWCPGCRRARAYFEAHAIPYVELDIGRDRVAAARVRGWAGGNETTPTIKVHGQIIVGFDEQKLNAALGI